MKCLSERALQEYLDGEVSGKLHRHMELHLSGCQGCRERAAALAATKDFILQKLKLLNPVEMPTVPAFSTPEMQLEQPQVSFFRRFFRLSVRMPVAAAAMAVLFVAGFLLGSIRHRQEALLSDSSSDEGSSALYIASNKVVRALPFKLDLTDYEPIDHPGLIITQEESR